jgi:hypothetical protein
MRNASMYVVNLMMVFYGVVEPYVEARSADLMPSPERYVVDESNT